jgi:hypothetical protein
MTRRNLDDVTWLQDGWGLAFDVVDAALTDDKRMTGRAGRVVVVNRSGAEFAIPGDISADLALELAQLLMLLASILDPAAVTRTVDRARQDELLHRLLVDMQPGSAH